MYCTFKGFSIKFALSEKSTGNFIATSKDKKSLPATYCRGVSGGWAEWAIAHPVFGRIEGDAVRRHGGRGAPHYYLPIQF